MRRILLLALAVTLMPVALAAQSEGEPPLVLRGVTLIDGTGAPPAPNTTVIVREGRIAARGPDGTVEVPPGARVLDAAAGRFVIPGLWDMHVHAMREGRSTWHVVRRRVFSRTRPSTASTPGCSPLT